MYSTVTQKENVVKKGSALQKLMDRSTASATLTSLTADQLGSQRKTETLCPVCSIEGRRDAAQSGHKYAGMCKRHAKMKTIEAEQRRPLPTCFVVCSRPLRHLCQMRAFARSSRGKRANQPTGRRAPAPSHLLTDVRHGRRHVRCAEPPCSKRARIDHDGERFCQSHARWRIELASLRVLRLTGSGRPPSRRSTLAAWVSKQKERLEKHSLTEGQKRLLESIPRWD